MPRGRKPTKPSAPPLVEAPGDHPDRPAFLLPASRHAIFLALAQNGTPPDPALVMREQYGLRTPWYVREHLLEPFTRIGRRAGVQKVCREVARGAGKTISATVAKLWAIEYVIPFLPKLRAENRRVLDIGRKISHVLNENTTILEQMVCERAPWLKTKDVSAWPRVPEDWAQLAGSSNSERAWTKSQQIIRLDFTNGASYRGYGWDQGVRGNHAPLVVIDDLLDEENFAFAEEQHTTLNNAVGPAIEEGGLIMLEGTPFMPGDLFDRVREDEDWDYRQLPAMDVDGALDYATKNQQDIAQGYLSASAITVPQDLMCLNPARTNYAALEGRQGKSRDAQLAYQREFLLRRVLDTTALVHPNDWAAAKRHDLPLARSLHEANAQAEQAGHPRIVSTYCGVDPSGSQVDAFAFVVVGRLAPPTSKLRILHTETIPLAEGRQNPLLFLDRLAEIHARYAPYFLVEANGFQRIIEPLTKSIHPNIRIGKLMVTSDKHVMDRGWPIIRTLFASGMIEVPWGPTANEQHLVLKSTNPYTVPLASHIAMQRLYHQLQGVQYVKAEIIEDDRRPNDEVSALYLALKAATTAPGQASAATANYSPGRAPLNPVDPRHIPAHRDPELNRTYPARALSPWEKVQRARGMERRR